MGQVGNGFPKIPLPPPPPPPPLGADPNAEALKRVEQEMKQVANEPKYTADERIGLMGELQSRINTLDQLVHPKEPIPPLVPEPVPVKEEPPATPAPPPPPPAPPVTEPESELEQEPSIKVYPSSVAKRFDQLSSEASEAVPPDSKEAIKKFIRKLQGHQKYFNVSKRGEFMYKSNAIKGSDMSDLVSSLFTGNPPKNDKGLQELIDGLTEARIPLPRGDHPKPKVEEEKEKSPGKRKRKSKKRDSQEGYERQQVGNGPPGKRIKLEFLYKR